MASTYLHASNGHHVFRDPDYPLRVVVSARTKRWEVFTTDGRTFHDPSAFGGFTRFGRETTVRPPAGAAKALREWIACERDRGREPFA